MWTRTRKRLQLCCAVLTLILAFIWGNSLLPSELSAAFSQWVRDLLGKLFLSGADDGEAGHGTLRKIAHFTEFACLGLTLCWLWGMLAKSPARTLLPALGCGFAVACVDEFLQIFVPGRSSSFLDVMIDFSGTTLGILALMLVYSIKIKKQQQYNLEENEHEEADFPAAGPGYGSVLGCLHRQRNPRHHHRQCRIHY